MSGLRIVVLHGEVPADAAPDEQDVLVEAATVCEALRELGHQPSTLAFSLRIDEVMAELRARRPDLVFNLVETVAGEGRLVHFAPAMLDVAGLPYTGAGSEAIYLTASKLLSKRWFVAAGIPTAPWLPLEQVDGERPDFPGPYFVKPVWEDASCGIDDASFVADRTQLLEQLAWHRSRQKGPAFLERYIAGREFNLSMLDGPRGPEVLPCAEIRFVDFPPEKLRIVGYAAKWDEESFECKNTVRSFEFPAGDGPLLAELRDLALRCWQQLELRGYARVDFRVDEAGRPFVLEVNANPCISPGSGFVAATEQAELTRAEVYTRIVEAALGRG